MLLRIFQNDFKRKKTMNIILLLFIILATVFVSSGISNLVTVMSGLDDYFDQAGVGDLAILQAGDTIELCYCGTELSLIIDGFAKDALLGSEMVGNIRFLMNGADMDLLLENEEIYTCHREEICYIDTEDVSAVSSAIAGVSNIVSVIPRATLKMCYVMYMIIVFVMLILSICLMLVSFVVLKFSISVSIAEEYREIGMLKAIGIGNGKIRFLYIAKYFVMGLAGGMIGLAAGVPYGELMLGAVSREMVLKNENALLLHIIGAALVVALILLFAFRCTRVVKKAVPVDAIRQGQTGERYRSRSVLKRSKWFGKNAGFLAVNDIFSNPKRYSFVVAAFGICTLFVLMLVNTTQTMKSDKLIASFSTLTDLYITDNASAQEAWEGTKQDLEDALDEQSEELAGLGMPNRMCVEVQYKYQATWMARIICSRFSRESTQA